MRKNEIIIPVTTIETRETRYIKDAKKAINKLRRLITEMDSEESLSTFIANKENENLARPYDNTALFYVYKSIDMNAIKEPLDRVEQLVKQLSVEVEKLESAITVELLKNSRA